MKPKLSKLQEAERQQTEQQLTPPQPEGREFASVEEMLRYDASLNAPPESVVMRLENSLPPPAAKKPWWKRLLGG